MTYWVIAFFCSFICTLLIVRYHHLHSRLTHDFDLTGPQKMHHKAVPRVGGLAIAFGLLGFTALAVIRKHPHLNLIFLLNFSSTYAFAAGLLEDITKKVSPNWRLLATFVSALSAFFLINSEITRVDIWGIDYLLTFELISLLLTCFAVAGIANAINIIDGFNGLSSVVVCCMLLSLIYVAFQVHDSFILSFALALFGAIFGFFVWNYPSGSIFLGDGGAYLIGFLVAELAVILVNRHLSISAWYPVLLFMYPLVETLFSVYRRRLKKRAANIPDGVHLHSLLYRRLIRWALGFQHIGHSERNAMTSPYLWILSSMAVIPATIFFEHGFVLLFFCLLFVLGYISLYWKLVRFQSPTWLSWINKHKLKDED